MPPFIPIRPEEVTPHWLTETLRVAGFRTATVASVDATPINSVTATVHRLHLTYTEPAADAPRTLIWKCSTADPAIRAAFSGGYEREVAFYREVAPTVRARIPRCFLAAFDATTGAHTILLEDFQGTHRGGALYEALSFEETAGALHELAALHASRWDADVPNPPQAATWQRYYVQELEANHEYFTDVVGAETLASLVPYHDRLAEWLPRLNSGPQSLVHWDTHPANVLFPRRPGDRPVIVDFQAWRTGAPIRDVALCIVMSLDIDRRREGEHALVDEYLSALREQGVQYDSARAFEDYRIGAALQWLSAVNFTRRRTLWADDLRAAMPVRIRRAAAALEDMLDG
jgi:hypothetical protein